MLLPSETGSSMAAELAQVTLTSSQPILLDYRLTPVEGEEVFKI
jgi:hypothetical protein